MNSKNITAFFITTLLFTGINNAQVIDSLYEVGTWRGFRAGAVSFTFDDNTPNQISVVLPIFDQYGFKMTFFPVINWGPNWTALQEAALNGHEIGSHTVSHTNLSSLTDEEQEAELKNSQDVINSYITAQKCLTIAYPYCALGNSSICNQYYLAARGCSGVIVPKTPSDFMNISSIICGSQGSIQRASDFTNKADVAASSNGWVVFLIHAIDNESGYSPTSSTELKNALDSLSRNNDKFWVSTFSNVARYIKERNNVSVKQISAQDSVITFSVTDTLDNSIYNYPLTIRRVLPEKWSSATISQNGKTISSRIVNVNDNNYVMFDVVPDSGDIKMTKEKITGISESFNYQIPTPILMQNYPNPFNPVTTIDYQIAENSFVTLKVYDLLGKEITTLVDKQLSPGNYSAKFDGSHLTSELYLYRLDTQNFCSTRKLILLK
ncbi:MAG: polysaccharide deacetylase family protein [Ignavibacteria bacterium]|jgi:oligosaccharide reducing-end xylanase